MEIKLEDGTEIAIKNINIVGGTVDYRRVNDPVYSGDCVLYLAVSDLATAEAEIKAALEVAKE